MEIWAPPQILKNQNLYGVESPKVINSPIIFKE